MQRVGYLWCLCRNSSWYSVRGWRWVLLQKLRIWVTVRKVINYVLRLHSRRIVPSITLGNFWMLRRMTAYSMGSHSSRHDPIASHQETISWAIITPLQATNPIPRRPFIKAVFCPILSNFYPSITFCGCAVGTTGSNRLKWPTLSCSEAAVNAEMGKPFLQEGNWEPSQPDWLSSTLCKGWWTSVAIPCLEKHHVEIRPTFDSATSANIYPAFPADVFNELSLRLAEKCPYRMLRSYRDTHTEVGMLFPCIIGKVSTFSFPSYTTLARIKLNKASLLIISIIAKTLYM